MLGRSNWSLSSSDYPPVSATVYGHRVMDQGAIKTEQLTERLETDQRFGIREDALSLRYL